MKILNQFNNENAFDYENGFYLTSQLSRMSKLLAHYELYKKIIQLPGAIVECGIFKGASFLQFASFRNLLENEISRKLIGFDIFDDFPETEYQDDKKYLDDFIKGAGSKSITVEELEFVLASKKIGNYSLVKGDINQTVPEFVKNNPHLKISLLHIDTDVYEPAVTILNNMYDLIVRGGIIVLDDYATFPGETKAVDEFFADKNITIQKFPFSHIPAYIIKP